MSPGATVAVEGHRLGIRESVLLDSVGELTVQRGCILASLGGEHGVICAQLLDRVDASFEAKVILCGAASSKYLQVEACAVEYGFNGW